MPIVTLQTIADHLRGELDGDPHATVCRVNTIDAAVPGDVVVLFEVRGRAAPAGGAATAAVVPADAPPTVHPNTVRVADPKRALAALLRLFHPEPAVTAGIHPTAIVSDEARVSPEAWIGPGVVLAAGAEIERGVRLHPYCVIGRDCRIGEASELFARVTLYDGTRIGRRVRIHAGAVIGSDGFGYLNTGRGPQEKMPQVGVVVIGDDVEIGANATVDRATLGTTHVREGSKIDNLVQIGHNADIGPHNCFASQVGVSGSVTTGQCCVMGGQVGIGDHVRLADHVVLGAKAGVHSDLGSGQYLGVPAMPVRQALKSYGLTPRLPEMAKRLKALEKRCRELEARLAGSSPEG